MSVLKNALAECGCLNVTAWIWESRLKLMSGMNHDLWSPNIEDPEVDQRNNNRDHQPFLRRDRDRTAQQHIEELRCMAVSCYKAQRDLDDGSRIPARSCSDLQAIE